MSALSKAATSRRTPKATARSSHNASSVIPNAIDHTLVIETRQFLESINRASNSSTAGLKMRQPGPGMNPSTVTFNDIN